LLVAAATTPISAFLMGPQLDNLLAPHITVAQSLEIPAMVINRDWHIHFFNDRMLALYNFTLGELDQVPPPKRNLLQLLFDPALPLQPTLVGNRPSWLRMARQTIYGFKVANQLCQFEDWYEDLVEQWMTLPEFEQNWHTVRTDQPFHLDPSTQNLPASIQLDTTIPHLNVEAALRPLLISAGYYQFDFPQIMALVPADENTQITLSEASIVA
ncbi:MAG: hypothetical protein AAF125_13055, partial [Chloroflexota bacterium]